MTDKPKSKSDGLLALNGPELVFGLVGAVGCDLATVSQFLSEALERAKYISRTVRVSGLLHQLDKYQGLESLGSNSEYDRIKRHMEAGTELRSISMRGDIMAWLAIGAIRKDKAGEMVKWSISGGDPKLKRFVASYLLIEVRVLGDLLPAKLEQIGIKPVT